MYILLYIKMYMYMYIILYYIYGQDATDIDGLSNPANQNLFQSDWCVIEPGKEHEVCTR